MSNQKTAAPTFKHVTPQLLQMVENVLGEGQKHTYSVSRVYAAYNGALQKKDNPQSCSSCLRSRVRDLTKWYAEYRKANPAKKGEKVIEVTEEEGSEFQTANQGVVAFTPEEEGAQYGIATKGGLPLPAGNYDHEGQQYAVSGEQGHYTVITGEPAGDAAKALAEGGNQEEGEQHQVTTDGALRLAEEGAQGINFVPNEGETVKGTVKWADGTNVKPGKYPLKDGRELAVQIGGKATIKEEDLT